MNKLLEVLLREEVQAVKQLSEAIREMNDVSEEYATLQVAWVRRTFNISEHPVLQEELKALKKKYKITWKDIVKYSEEHLTYTKPTSDIISNFMNGVNVGKEHVFPIISAITDIAETRSIETKEARERKFAFLNYAKRQ